MPTCPVRTLCLCAALLATALAGCADQLKVTPPPHPPHLTGDWQLDQAASERLDIAVADLQAQLSKHMHHAHSASPSGGVGTPHRERDASGGGQGPRQTEGSGGPNTQQAPAVVVSAPRVGANLVQEFVAGVPEGDDLALRVAPSVFTLQTGEGSQQCTPGVPIAVTLGEVAANLTCGWQDASFVVRTEPLYGPTLTERYGLAPDGELVLTLRLAGGGLDVRLVRRYRRTSHPPSSPLPSGN